MEKKDFKDIETYKQLGLIDAEIANQNIYANNYDLKSLLGCPKEVDGDFSCKNNFLQTLDHRPKIIRKNFVCSYNELT